MTQELEKLKQREAERDKVLEHKKAKLNQLREELDSPTTSPKVIQMKNYIKTVDEKLQAEEKKVNAQKEVTKKAEIAVEEAIADLNQKRLEVDKFTTHQKDWEKEMRKEMEIIEAREQDELGSTMFLGKMQSKKVK